MGTICRLDAFYRTQLLLDQKNFFNSFTSYAFLPLQHLIGQNRYVSLEGRVIPLPPHEATAAGFFPFSAVKKVVVWVGAFFLTIVLTPVGTVTRYLSFRSSNVNQAYTLAFLLQLTELEFDRLKPDQFPLDLWEQAKQGRTIIASMMVNDQNPVFPPSRSAPHLEQDAAEPGESGSETTVFIEFLTRLDDQLQKHSDDSAAMEAWLKTEVSNKEYPYHFYSAHYILYALYMTESADHERVQRLYDSCAQRLKGLGLERYIQEKLPPEIRDEQKKALEESKEVFQRITKECLSILRPLSEALKTLTGFKENDRPTMAAWFAQTKKTSKPSYNNPFYFAPYLLCRRDLLTDILGEAPLKELDELDTACRNQLLALDLKSIVEERPSTRVLLTEIEQAIQNPSANVSLNQHLRFYLEKYPAIMRQLVPSNLLAQWEAAFSTRPEEAPSLPSPDAAQPVLNFFKTLSTKIKESDETALSWLKEEASLATYCFPFYYSSYWQTLPNTEEANKFTLVSKFHQKIIPWLHQQAEIAHFLCESPPHEQQGLCRIVHAIADKTIICPALPQAAQTDSTPTQSLVPDHRQVDDASFKKVIIELLPHMAPLLEDPAMFHYWKNSLLDRAVLFCSTRTGLCQQILTANKPKKDVDVFLQQHLQLPDSTGAVTQLSQDYVKVIDKLAPLLPSHFITAWRAAYDQCCKFLNNISATEYLTAKAPPFLGDTYHFEQQILNELKEATKFFEGLSSVPDDKLPKKISDNPLMKEGNFKPFWFAREFKALCEGYEVKFVTKKQQKELKRFSLLFKQFEERLTRLKRQDLLNEAAPQRNFLVLRMMGVSHEIIEKLKRLK